MPPQQTDIISKGDAAALRPDIALVGRIFSLIRRYWRALRERRWRRPRNSPCRI